MTFDEIREFFPCTKSDPLRLEICDVLSDLFDIARHVDQLIDAMINREPMAEEVREIEKLLHSLELNLPAAHRLRDICEAYCITLADSSFTDVALREGTCASQEIVLWRSDGPDEIEKPAG